MAWNPSPEVAAARDFASRFGGEQVIILHLDRTSGRIGYASYGKSKRLCDDAKTLADVALEAVTKYLTTGERP